MAGRASRTIRSLWSILVAGVALFRALADAQSGALPEVPAELETVRAAMTKYQDPVVAVRDGYFSTLGCVQYPTGGMGIHFLNLKLVGPVPDPMKPPILLYEPGADGQLVLVGIEYFIPLATGIQERPSLFGQPFHGPMEGHEPLQPAGLHHYDLHVWLFKTNPAGLFEDVNPAVTCSTGYNHNFSLKPPKSVPHPK